MENVIDIENLEQLAFVIIPKYRDAYFEWIENMQSRYRDMSNSEYWNVYDPIIVVQDMTVFSRKCKLEIAAFIKRSESLILTNYFPDNE